MDDALSLPPPTADAAYDADFHAWAMDQGHKLREGRFDALDLANLAEEIESMGRAEKRELSSRLTVLLTHLLKWAAQPARRGRSWANTIGEQRDQAAIIIRDNPSLRPVLPEILADAYRLGRRGAIRETGLSARRFPASCPWTWGQVTNETFLPDALTPP